MVRELLPGQQTGAESVACRSCGQVGLTMILSLGRTPLANALLTKTQLGHSEPTYALNLVLCPECALVQITETVPPEDLFCEYVYFSSYSDTMLQHSGTLARRLARERCLDADSLVVEAASNDGYLLQFYRDLGVPVLGIEPARNIAEVAEQRGVPTLCEFFGGELAKCLVEEGRRADVFHAHNVLAHVPDLNGFVRGIETLLDVRGLAVIEAPYVKDLIDHIEFDTIYHEHLCYFSLTALDELFRRNGLSIVDVDRLPIHGGSLRVFISKDESIHPSAAVSALLAEEKTWVRDVCFYQEFGRCVEHLRTRLTGLLRKLKAENRRIAAYGASAKGSTLLNYFGIGQDVLDFIVDRSAVKQGRYTPGTHLRIYEPEKLLEEMPDYCLLLTWNFAEEILDQQQRYRDNGGRFIIPIPKVRVA